MNFIRSDPDPGCFSEVGYRYGFFSRGSVPDQFPVELQADFKSITGTFTGSRVRDEIFGYDTVLKIWKAKINKMSWAQRTINFANRIWEAAKLLVFLPLP